MDDKSKIRIDDVELSGWWNGRAVVDSPVDEQAYEDFFDTENLNDHHKSMILSISNESDEAKQAKQEQYETEKKEHPNDIVFGPEIVPANMLNEYARKQILDQVMEGNMSGTIMCDGNDLQWSWEPEISLEGMKVDFQDGLSDVSKKHIAEATLEHECIQGEVFEIVDLEYQFYMDVEPEMSDGHLIGEINAVCTCPTCEALNNESFIPFNYDTKTGSIEINTDDVKLIGNSEEELNAALQDFVVDMCRDSISLNNVFDRANIDMDNPFDEPDSRDEEER